MPPPPSPSRNRVLASSAVTPGRPASRQSDAFSSRSQSRQSDHFGGVPRPPTPKSSALQNLEANQSALEEQIATLMGTSGTGSRRTSGGSVSGSAAGEGDLHVATHTDSEFYELVARLESQRMRIEALENENLGLLLDKDVSSPARGPPSTSSIASKPVLPRSPSMLDRSLSSNASTTVDPSAESRAVAAERQVQAHATRLAILESELSASSSTLEHLQSTVSTLEATNASLVTDHEVERAASHAQVRELKTKLEASEALTSDLKEAFEGKERGEGDMEVELMAKKREVEALQAKLARLSSEHENDRSELGGQVEVLRQAGQVSWSFHLLDKSITAEREGQKEVSLLTYRPLVFSGYHLAL